ncbi:MAG TPA: hypothetical protein VL100_11040 [Croceibacterium sp.]|nr:hypothetical protein [Croceibacterium sp.]
MSLRTSRATRRGVERNGEGSQGGRVAGEAKQELIRAYKSLLKEAVEARPSGMRLRIASQIGKNKSFVSQITSPNYKTPLPEKYVEPILDAIHLTKREREQFLDIYHRAHPRARGHAAEAPAGETRTLQIELPKLESRRLENRVDQLVLQFARNLSELTRRR